MYLGQEIFSGQFHRENPMKSQNDWNFSDYFLQNANCNMTIWQNAQKKMILLKKLLPSYIITS
jgi:hypothetical protein